MKYSVLMPLWYKEDLKYLEQSLTSMAMQTAKPDEIVMIQDHGITQEMSSLITKISDQHHVEINIYQNFDLDGKGLSAILSYGVHKCRNELIARMDTDDIAFPVRCEKELEVFQRYPHMALVGGWITEFADSTDNVSGIRRVPEYKPEIIKFSKLRCPFNHPSVMFKKSVILEVGNYDDKIRKAEDYDLWYRVLKSENDVYNIQESLLWFRSGKEQNKRRKDKAHYQARIDVKRKMLSDCYLKRSEYLFIVLIEAINHYLPSNISSYFKQR